MFSCKIIMPQSVCLFVGSNFTATVKNKYYNYINCNANLKSLAMPFVMIKCGACSGLPQTIHKNTGSAWVGLVITHTSHGINTEKNSHNNSVMHNLCQSHNKKHFNTVQPDESANLTCMGKKLYRMMSSGMCLRYYVE